MIFPNLKNFSLFNFEIFRLIHYYSQILGFNGTVQSLDVPIRHFTVTMFFYHKNIAYISLLVTTF